MVNPGPRWRRCVQCGRLWLSAQPGAAEQPASIKTVACDCGDRSGEALQTAARLLERCDLSPAADAVARRLLASVFPHGLPG